MYDITKEELQAIKFYLGDKKTVEEMIYRGGGKAYITINAILNAGIRNEVDKAKEGKTIEIYDVEHFKSYLKLINDVFRASVKYRNHNVQKDVESLTSYRVDRYSSFDSFIHSNNGIIEGFFSTCKNGLLPEYANSKKDIVLLQVERESDVPYIDFGCLMKDFYSKPEEAEILIPFGTKIKGVQEIPLTPEEEILYHDLDGNKPRGKWLIHLGAGTYEEVSDDVLSESYNYITNERELQQIIKDMQDLTNHIELSDEEKKLYSEWKAYVSLYINGCSYRTLNQLDHISHSISK